MAKKKKKPQSGKNKAISLKPLSPSFHPSIQNFSLQASAADVSLSISLHPVCRLVGFSQWFWFKKLTSGLTDCGQETLAAHATTHLHVCMHSRHF